MSNVTDSIDSIVTRRQLSQDFFFFPFFFFFLRRGGAGVLTSLISVIADRLTRFATAVVNTIPNEKTDRFSPCCVSFGGW